MMQQLMQDLVTWISASKGTIIGVIGIVLAVVFYRKGKEKKEFSYSLRSSTLIRGKKRKLEKLSVTYGEQKIDDLCVSRFTIWNSGNKTLNGDDMVATKEVTITAAEESRILDADLIMSSEETNKFSVQIINKNTVKVLFDYVDKREGAVVQILHTGTNDTLKIDCKIKGGLPIKNFVNETFPRIINRTLHKTLTMKVMSVIFVAMMLGLFVNTLVQTMAALGIDVHTMLFESNAVAESPAPESKHSVVVVGVLWLYSLGYLVLGIPMLKIVFMIGMPRSLKKHSGFDN